jgi:hypothetical protein
MKQEFFLADLRLMNRKTSYSTAAIRIGLARQSFTAICFLPALRMDQADLAQVYEKRG